MFTGLVQAVGRVAGVRPGAKTLRLEINPGSWGHRPTRGDSICVSGVCLTVVDTGRGRWAFDVVAETLAKTTLGRVSVGDSVNLEHAATATTLLGGHIVQGHIDGVGRVEHVQEGEDWRVWFSVPKELAEYLAPKGSICVEGVSLTIASIWEGAPDVPGGARRGRGKGQGFSVALIPETLERTTLAGLRTGDTVNLEMDAMAKSIVFWLRRFGVGAASVRKKRKSSKRTARRDRS
ncbi:MAG: riboflavin synthase [Phycisphaerales bacterium]|nr:riboflavin synthase [Phycisphaerales bacterium]